VNKTAGIIALINTGRLLVWLSYFKTDTVWLGEIFEASEVTQSYSKLENFLSVMRN